MTKHLPTLLLTLLAGASVLGVWHAMNLMAIQGDITNWLLVALVCFGISGFCRLMQLSLMLRGGNETPKKETPVRPVVEPRWDDKLSPDTVLVFCCHCIVCGKVGGISTSRSAYVRDEMQDIIAGYRCDEHIPS